MGNNYLPTSYQPNWGYNGVGQQVYPQYQQQSMAAQPQMQNTAQNQQGGPGLIWVDGEVGAKAYQMPVGWPCNQPIALWDTNDTLIYLKSTNPMGMPNPLQKAHYWLEEHRSASPVNAMQSGAKETQAPQQDMGEYVRKDDMERMKQELMEAIGNVSTSAQAGAVTPKRTGTKGDA